MQFFSLFEIPPQFAIDERALDTKFRALQSQTHPDKFAAASDAERRAAEQRSALVNDAYKTLKDPVARAAYLIEKSCGVDPFDERNTKMPADFLMQQIELREEIAENRAERNAEALEETLARVQVEIKKSEGLVQGFLDDSHDYESATTEVRKLRFLSKVASEIDETLAEI